MKNILFVFIFAAAPIFAQIDSARHYLALAASDGSIEHFNKFAEYYDNLSAGQKLDVTYGYMPHYYFLSILFTNRPTAEIFKTYLKTSEILGSNAEGGEVISGYFSYYFTNNMPASLEILEKINDEKIISDIFSELNERSCMKILEYITKNKLQTKPYYKFVKDYL